MQCTCGHPARCHKSYWADECCLCACDVFRPTMNNFSIVRTHPHLIDYVDSLQRKNAEALSFYPRCVFERESENGRLFLALLNGEPCGYIYVGSGRNGVLRCHQVCIQYDARRRLYGAALVVAMEEYANEVSSGEVILRCGFDLEANDFWRSLDYSCVRVEDGGIRRSRKINIWSKLLQPQLFSLEHIEPACGKTSQSAWLKHKKTGIITGFHRGKNLRQYKAHILGVDGVEVP